jgi:phage tail sheath gpL-like
MTISFDAIPINLRTPGAYIEISNAQALQGLPQMPSRILVFGQILAGATAAPNIPILVATSGSPDAMFGRGSMLSQMCKAIKAANPWTELWAMPLSDNGAGAQATGSAVLSGSPVANGTLGFYVNGTLVQAGVSAGDSAATVATALTAAIAAVEADLGVTAVIDGENTAKIDITAAHKGIDAGNTMDLRATYYTGDTVPAGLAIAITAMAGGTANPILATALANLGNQWFTDWILPYTDAGSIAAVANAVETLWGPMAMKDARVWGAIEGTVGSLAAFGVTNDEKLLTTLGVAKAPQPVYLWAAVYGAVGAYNLSNDPARPLQQLPLTGLLAPAMADRFVLTDRNTLLYDGIATFTVDDGGNVLIERAITSYRVNASGVADPSYLDIETLATLAYLRYSTRARIVQKFPRYKLADDGTKFDAGAAVVTPSVIRNELIALASEWEAAVLVEDITDFKTQLIVQRDAQDPNRIDAMLPPNIVNQLRVFAGQVAFIL